jgi:hypothetical protein
MRTMAFIVVAVSLSTGCNLVKVGGLGRGPATHASNGSESSASGSNGAVKAASGGATDNWRAALRAGGDDLESFHYFATVAPKADDTAPDQKFEHANKLRKNDMLRQIAEQCAAGAYNGEQTNEKLRAGELCPLLIKREEVLVRSARAWADRETERRVDELARDIDTIKKEGKVSLTDLVEGRDAKKDREYVTAFVGKYYQALGQPVPQPLLARIDKIATDRDAAILDAAKSNTEKLATGRDPGAEKAIAEEYAQANTGIKIRRVRMVDSDWKPVHNDIGVVLRRYKDSEVIVEAKSGGVCAVVHASVGQQHSGGGSFAPKFGVDTFIDARPVVCPK